MTNATHHPVLCLVALLLCSCDEPDSAMAESAERWDAFSDDAAMCVRQRDNVRQCAIQPRNNEATDSPIYECLWQSTTDFTEPASDLFETWQSCVSGACSTWASLERLRNTECNYTHGDLLDLCVYEMLGIEPDPSLDDECHWDIDTSTAATCWDLADWCRTTDIYAPGQGY